MKDEIDYLDLGFDDECYSTSWDMMRMWYKRIQKLQKIHNEKIENDKEISKN